MGEFDSLRALGQPIEILRRFVVHGDRMSTAYSIELSAVRENEVQVDVRYEPGVTPLRMICDGHLELYPRLVEILGCVATATHPLCARRGDDRCRFSIRWDAEAAFYGENDHVGLLERLHLAARAMAAAEDDDAVLDLALAGARDLTFTGVQGLVLVVDSTDDLPRSVRTAAFADALAAEHVVAVVLRGGQAAAHDPVLLTTPLDSGRVILGSLTACFPPGSYTTAHDERIFAAYAGHVAAALESRQLRRQLRHQALHDELTGLPNRTLLRDRAEQATRQARRASSAVGLLFVDLDRFKLINDTLGHAAGDAVLQEVASRLRCAVREADTVARVGGDEFVILLPAIRVLDDVRKVADQVHAALSSPVLVSTGAVDIACTLGITTTIDRPHDTWDELLRVADKAMYAAKPTGSTTPPLTQEQRAGGRHLPQRLTAPI